MCFFQCFFRDVENCHRITQIWHNLLNHQGHIGEIDANPNKVLKTCDFLLNQSVNVHAYATSKN